MASRAKAHADGLAEGEAKGKADGLAEGLAEGKAHGLAEGEARARVEMAKNLLADGISPEVVARNTGLSLEDIHALMN
jgi:predicted transposase/invertase (TIGR01784 family)